MLNCNSLLHFLEQILCFSRPAFLLSLQGNRHSVFSPELLIFFFRLPRLTAYQKAEEDYKCKQEEKIAKLKEDQKKRQERSQAIARYQNNKAEVFKKLSKKTKKGQPVMKGRIEILLEKLQQDLQS